MYVAKDGSCGRKTRGAPETPRTFHFSILIDSRIVANSFSETSGPSCGPDMLIMKRNVPRGTIHMRDRVLNSRPSALATVYLAFMVAAGRPPTFVSFTG